jgi:transposase-like protein
MSRRRYSEKERQDALELYVEHGAPETARRLNIPKDTVASWARRAGLQTGAAGASRARARTESARARWEEVSQEHREQLAGRLLAEVHSLAEQLQAPSLVRQVVVLSGGKDTPASWAVADVELPHPTARDQRDRASAIGVLVEKVQLLSGGATERLDTGEYDLEAEMHKAQADKVELAHLRAVVNRDST